MRFWDTIAEDGRLTPVQRLAELVRQVTVEAAADADDVVDVGFFSVTVTEGEVEDRDVREALLDALDYATGEFTQVSRVDFEGGLGYMELGAWLGDQGLALRFMGLVSHFDFADVMTPARLGITGDEAKEMMGMGLVMLVPNVAELY